MNIREAAALIGVYEQYRVTNAALDRVRAAMECCENGRGTDNQIDLYGLNNSVSDWCREAVYGVLQKQAEALKKHIEDIPFPTVEDK